VKRVAAVLLLAGCVPEEAPDIEWSMLAVTFNTGTTDGLGHDAPPDDGYTSAHAATSDEHYGDGLAWLPAVDATAAFFADLQPDVVGFQEAFWTGECGAIPPEAHADFLCEREPADVDGGAPSVANLVLGPEYAVACHVGKPDKCVAVRSAWGSIRGCAGELCLDGAAGEAVDGCGSGARVASVIVDLVGGGELSVVHVHGSSGITGDDQRCREAQFDQAFAATNPAVPNLVLGDLNTDPGRYSGIDGSAARWNEGIADGGFVVHTDVGIEATPTYGGLTNIDHVASDAFVGDCVHPGLGTSEPVIEATYFDHLPAVCRLEVP